MSQIPTIENMFLLNMQLRWNGVRSDAFLVERNLDMCFPSFAYDFSPECAVLRTVARHPDRGDPASTHRSYRDSGRRAGGEEGSRVQYTSLLGRPPVHCNLYTPAANVAGRSECPTLRGLSRFAPQVAEMLVELAVAGSGG